MDADRVEPSIYHAWLLQLARLIEQDKLGEPLFSETWSERPVFLLNVLHNQMARAAGAMTPGPRRLKACDELKTHALDLALADLTAHYGNDPRKWQWGRLHQARSVHAPFDHVAYLAPLFDLVSPVGGDSETIDVGQFRAGQGNYPFAAYHAPSLRGIYDLSAPEQSVFIQSTGESGSLLSPLYSNMEKRWVDVGYRADAARAPRG